MGEHGSNAPVVRVRLCVLRSRRLLLCPGVRRFHKIVWCVRHCTGPCAIPSADFLGWTHTARPRGGHPLGTKCRCGEAVFRHHRSRRHVAREVAHGHLPLLGPCGCVLFPLCVLRMWWSLSFRWWRCHEVANVCLGWPCLRCQWSGHYWRRASSVVAPILQSSPAPQGVVDGLQLLRESGHHFSMGTRPPRAPPLFRHIGGSL